MDDYAKVRDEVAAMVEDYGGIENLTLDQRLEVAHIRALLCISHEVSSIHHEGIADYAPPRSGRVT